MARFPSAYVAILPILRHAVFPEQHAIGTKSTRLARDKSNWFVFTFTAISQGTASKTSNVKEIENMVTNIQGDKRLVLIEDADENLCIPMSKQVQCGLTQTMLDQIVQDEIGDFMISISGYQPPTKEELQEYEDQEIARNRLVSS